MGPHSYAICRPSGVPSQQRLTPLQVGYALSVCRNDNSGWRQNVAVPLRKHSAIPDCFRELHQDSDVPKYWICVSESYSVMWSSCLPSRDKLTLIKKNLKIKSLWCFIVFKQSFIYTMRFWNSSHSPKLDGFEFKHTERHCIDSKFSIN